MMMMMMMVVVVKVLVVVIYDANGDDGNEDVWTRCNCANMRIFVYLLPLFVCLFACWFDASVCLLVIYVCLLVRFNGFLLCFLIVSFCIFIFFMHFFFGKIDLLSCLSSLPFLACAHFSKTCFLLAPTGALEVMMVYY